MSSIVPLHQDRHLGLKVKDVFGLQRVKQEQFIPLAVSEFIQASIDHPVVYIKDAETGQFKTVIMLGFEPEENLYGQDLEWANAYIPFAIKSYPFFVVPQGENQDELMICIDEDSDILNSSEGHDLFDENGDQTEYLQKRIQSLVDFIEQIRITEAFTQFLVEQELLQAKRLTVQLESGEKLNIEGIYIIDEAKLNEMSSQDFEQLRRKGFLPAIYAHLASLYQVNRLISKRTKCQ